jgi:geranylgeranyl diphosphate synthase, type I
VREKKEEALERFTRQMLPKLEEELRCGVKRVDEPGMEELCQMLFYHMGWEVNGKNISQAGKRIRPILVLLSAAAAGGNWERALPAAAAVELVHNFSLIHDDIEDNSPQRRGRPTVWKKWGEPQAINAGDALFTLAHLALLRLEETTDAVTTLKAAHLLQVTCLQLTQGQYLDIAYENRNDLSLDAYWTMVKGKTAALIGACTELGALAAGSPDEIRHAYGRFGSSLGLAFQALDDLLGIWGDSQQIGKSVESDLTSGKKSLPVLYGLHQRGKFAARWKKGDIQAEEAPELAALLEAEGALVYTRETAAVLTERALQALDEAQPKGEAGAALRELADQLLNRQI